MLCKNELMVKHPWKHPWRVILSHYLDCVVGNLEVQTGNEICSRLFRKSVAESRGKLLSDDSQPKTSLLPII